MNKWPEPPPNPFRISFTTDAMDPEYDVEQSEAECFPPDQLLPHWFNFQIDAF